MDYAERNIKIIELRKKKVSILKIAKMFGISHQRVTQIWAKRNKRRGRKYSKKTIGIKPKKNVRHLKQWTSRRRKYLGLPDGEVKVPNGDGRNFVRELVRMRDNHTCQKCGKVWVVGTRRLDVHHQDEKMEGKSAVKGIIKMDKKSISKMITFCHKCHFSEHSVREKLKAKRQGKWAKFIGK